MNKHLNLMEREAIYQGLVDKKSLASIARSLHRHPSTVANEIKSYRQFEETGCFNRAYNPCLNRRTCARKGVCHGHGCQKRVCARNCQSCHTICSVFVEEVCPRLTSIPYVCHGCRRLNTCTLKKAYYKPAKAHRLASDRWSERRSGCSYTPETIERIDSIVSPLIMKGQSIYHIHVHHKEELMVSTKTLYNLVNGSLLRARAIDCPRIVRFRPRRASKPLKLNTKCRVNRTYQDYLSYYQAAPDLSLVEIDTVEGRKGGKVLLTMVLTSFDIFLAFLRDQNDAASVIKSFDHLKEVLGLELYCQLFALVLTDNGSEFSQPTKMEVTHLKGKSSRLFYCDPKAPEQKPHIENAHGLLRRVLPSGSSFDHLTQQDVDLIVSNINSYSREKLNGSTPFKLFSSVYPPEILQDLQVSEIDPNDINLTPSLLLK